MRKETRMINNEPPARTRALGFGFWDFSGVWDLGFGILKFTLFVILTALSPLPLHAQTNAIKTPLSSNRYLLILETSKSMQPRSEAVIKAVQDLLTSGIGGQLRRGDTLGLWTFNEEVYAGRFQLQRWFPEAHRSIGIRLLDFIKEQNYEKRGSLEQVLSEMDRVIKGSQLITIILISDGAENISGTPFDDKINETYKLWQRDQQKAKQPFLTLLRAKGGKFTEYAVTPAPWPLEIPPLPPEPQIAQAATNKPPAAPPKAPLPVVQPLIISGKKPQPEPVETSKAAASLIKPPEPTPSPELAKTGPVPAVPGAPPTQAILPQPSAPNALQEAKQVATYPIVTNVLQPAPPAKPEAAQASTFSQDPKPDLAAVPTAPPQPPPEATTDTTSTQSARSSALPAATPPAQDAAAIPPFTFPGYRLLWVATIAFAAILLTVVLLRFRRRQTLASASLITRSLDREKV
jgi:hypothetical protein